MIVAGLMAGSSMDGLDIAVVSFDAEGKFRWIAGSTAALPTAIASRLRQYEGLSTVAYLELERDLSHYMGTALTDYCTTLSTPPTLVGVHGHTLIHTPSEGLTKQVSDGGIIAAVTGMDVVTDFRIQDIVRGGVGTPLVSILERQQLQGYDYYLNLGGIANITHVDTDSIAAYDICPCNQLLNHFALQQAGIPYDGGGNIARKGTYNPRIIAALEALPYWDQIPPKAIDNSWIRDVCMPLIRDEESLEDILHTVCCWIAEKIAKEMTRKERTKMLVTGGGVHNSFLLEKISIAAKAQNCTVHHGQAYLTDYKEAILMAYMAYLRVTNKPNVLAAVTGAHVDSCAGAHYKGSI